MENKNMYHLNRISKLRDKNSLVSEEQKEELLLLETNAEAQDHFNILNKIGLTNHIISQKKQAAVENEVYVEQASYSRPAFKGSEIIELCEKFDLFLVRGDNFEGVIPLEFAKAIKEFADSNDYTSKMSDTREVTKSKVDMVYQNFYVLCTENKANSETLSLFYAPNGENVRAHIEHIKENWDTELVISENSNKRISQTIFLEVCSTGRPFSNFRKLHGLTHGFGFLVLLAFTVFGVIGLFIHLPILFLIFTILGTGATLLNRKSYFKQQWFKYLN